MEKKEPQVQREWVDRLSETINCIPWEACAETWEFTYVGPQAVKILGYPTHQWYEKGFWTDHIHPEDREQTIDFCLQSSQTHKDYEFEYRMVASDGSVVWLHDVVTVESVNGTPKVLRGFMIDITKRRLREEKLKRSERRLREVVRALKKAQEEIQLRTTMLAESEERFRTMIDTAPDAMLLIRQDGTIALVNSFTEEQSGYKRSEMVGQPLKKFIPESGHSNSEQILKDFFSRPQRIFFDGSMGLMALAKDGKEFPVEVAFSPLETPEGVVACMTFRDITKRRRAEKAAQKSQESLAEAQRIAHLGSWEWNVSNNITVASDEYYRIFGLTQGTEVTYESFLNCLHPDDREDVKAKLDKALFENQPHQIDFRIILASGEVRFIHCEARVHFDEAGDPIRQVGTVHDITKRKQAEVKVQEVQKQVRALSRHLIQAQEEERRRIALDLHDRLGQELALFSIEIEQLKQKAPKSQAQLVEGLQELATRMRTVSSQVHDLSHQLHPSQLIHLGLVAASRSLCKEVSQASGIQIDFSHSNIPKSIPQDTSVCLYRVLQESLTNMVKHSGTRAAQVKLAGASGEIRVSVSDSGAGFDPKDPEGGGNGYGLGLIGMRERLDLVGGELFIESQPSAGTRITAQVPLNSSATPV